MRTEDDEPDRPIHESLRAARHVVRMLRSARMRLTLGSRYSAGRDTAIGARAVIMAPDSFQMGDHVRIGRELFVGSNVTIGSHVLISSRVAFISDDHEIGDPESRLFWQGRRPPATTVVEGDNLIGHGCILIAPVRIGRGAVVGAGSIVTRDLPPYTICVGQPARPIGDRRSTEVS